jgi:hypothetical protein
MGGAPTRSHANASDLRAGGLVTVAACAAGEAGETGEVPCRRRMRALPGRLGVLFVLGLCLFSGDSYLEVLRQLLNGLDVQLAAAGWRYPVTAALTKLRRRTGERVLELLFWRLASPLSPGPEPWSHICGLLALAWDSTTVRAQASDQDIAAFGRPGTNSGDPAHYPQLRLVTLIACGTRALAGAAIGPLTEGERALAQGLVRCLHAGMLLVADRGYYSWSLWQAAAATQAHLLWRVKSDMHLPVVRELDDGSFLSRISDPREVARRTRRNGKRRRRGSTLPPDTGPLPGSCRRCDVATGRTGEAAGWGYVASIGTGIWRSVAMGV